MKLPSFHLISTLLAIVGTAMAQSKAMYIVLLKDAPEFSAVSVDSFTAEYPDVTVKNSYTIIKGFAGEMTEEDVAKLKNDPRVKTIERDGEVHATSGSGNDAEGGMEIGF
eukprot:83514_1